MLDNAHSLAAFAPALVLAGLVVVLLVVDLAVARLRAGWCAAFTVTACLLAGWATRATATEPHALFFGLIARDAFADFWTLLALATCALVAVVAVRAGDESAAELYALVATATLGVMLMAAATDLLLAYLALETTSIPCYLLAGFRRRSRASAEAALKYVVYGAVASGVMLYGLSLLYGLSGGTSFAAVARAAAATPSAMTVLLAVVLCIAGFGYKVAAVPFHMWCPDVYEGAPTAVTAFFSVAPKAGGFALLLRFTGLLPHALGGTPAPWPLVFALVAAATMTLGNLTALPQTRVKRLLAYSSIAHAGYALCAVAVGGVDGARAVLVYLLTYLPASIGAFAVVHSVEDAAGDTLESSRGIGRRAPLAAAAMTVFLLSLTGLPPLSGFFGKLYVFSALVGRGGSLMVTLAVVAVANSALSLYYYARVLAVMYFAPPSDDAPVAVDPLDSAILALLTLATAALFLIWSPLSALVDASLPRW